MTKKDLIKGLLSWFYLAPNELRSMSSIDYTCAQLNDQYCLSESSTGAKYVLLFPLIRYGVIEFYGENKFGLSPSALIQSDEYIAFINISNSSDLLAKPLFSVPGISLYLKSDLLAEDLKKSNLIISRFCLIDCLSQIASLEKIITHWPDSNVIELGKCFHLSEDNTWHWQTPSKEGIYKKTNEPYAQKLLFIAQDKCKNIPMSNQQIDAFAIAHLWSQIKNNRNIGITYLSKQNTLVINTYFFPLLIERLLFIHTLLKGKTDFDTDKRHYLLNPKEFTLLNKFFENRIRVI